MAVLLTALGVGAIPPGVAGQDPGDGDGAPSIEVESRITARRLGDGRTEFAVQLRRAGGEWGSRILPERRFFPADVAEGRWLASSPVALGDRARVASGVHDVRVVARRVEDGRTEFGLRFRGGEGSWSQTQLPRRRFFPAGAAVDRWLVSSPLAVTPGGSTGRAPAAATPEREESGDDRDPDRVTQVAVSQARTCAVRAGGQVSCRGRNHLQEWLSTARLSDVVMIDIAGNHLGQFHTCVLHRDATVSCWGLNYGGRLGLGDDHAAHYLPAKVPGISDAVAVAVGDYHTCVLHAGGGVSCWGGGLYGQVGDGRGVDVRSPKRVPGLRDVSTIAAGGFTNCATHADGSLSCWGFGVGDSPRKVRGVTGAVSVSIGSDRVCVVTADGRVSCWSLADSPRPAPVSGIDDAVAVATGDHAVCAMLRDGGVSCWGQKNESGQLGDGTRTSRVRPRRLEGVGDTAAIALSRNAPNREAHACALQRDGSIACWGGNGFGQIGDGTHDARLTPTRVDVPIDTRPEQLPADPTALLRIWMDRTLEVLGAEHPWLLRAWDHIRDRSRVVRNPGYAGAVFADCRVSGGVYTCRANEMRIGLDAMDVEVLVHELAHVYDFTTGLAPSRAWGAVQLYFTTTIEGCEHDPWSTGVEILADAMRYLVVPGDGKTYLDHKAPGCPTLPSRLSDEAWEVLRAGLAGEVPAWYTDNITDGATLWAQFLRGRSPTALANLATEFGGLCSLHWATFPLNPATLPPAGTDPFC